MCIRDRILPKPSFPCPSQRTLAVFSVMWCLRLYLGRSGKRKDPNDVHYTNISQERRFAIEHKIESSGRGLCDANCDPCNIVQLHRVTARFCHLPLNLRQSTGHKGSNPAFFKPGQQADSGSPLSCDQEDNATATGHFDYNRQNNRTRGIQRWPRRNSAGKIRCCSTRN